VEARAKRISCRREVQVKNLRAVLKSWDMLSWPVVGLSLIDRGKPFKMSVSKKYTLLLDEVLLLIS
jgi:hypothetical protein